METPADDLAARGRSIFDQLREVDERGSSPDRSVPEDPTGLTVPGTKPAASGDADRSSGADGRESASGGSTGAAGGGGEPVRDGSCGVGAPWSPPAASALPGQPPRRPRLSSRSAEPCWSPNRQTARVSGGRRRVLPPSGSCRAAWCGQSMPATWCSVRTSPALRCIPVRGSASRASRCFRSALSMLLDGRPVGQIGVLVPRGTPGEPRVLACDPRSWDDEGRWRRPQMTSLLVDRPSLISCGRSPSAGAHLTDRCPRIPLA